MNTAIMKGIGFGLTSGIITTLGLIVGLYSSTGSKSVVLGGIIIIAVADALSDALGMHISEESAKAKKKQIWHATGATFIAKLIVALTFIIPVLLFTLTTAVIASIAWGILLIAGFSYYIGKKEKQNPWKAVAEHIMIAILVIITTHFIGEWVGAAFS